MRRRPPLPDRSRHEQQTRQRGRQALRRGRPVAAAAAAAANASAFSLLSSLFLLARRRDRESRGDGEERVRGLGLEPGGRPFARRAARARRRRERDVAARVERGADVVEVDRRAAQREARREPRALVRTIARRASRGEHAGDASRANARVADALGRRRERPRDHAQRRALLRARVGRIAAVAVAAGGRRAHDALQQRVDHRVVRVGVRRRRRGRGEMRRDGVEGRRERSRARRALRGRIVVVRARGVAARRERAPERLRFGIQDVAQRGAEERLDRASRRRDLDVHRGRGEPARDARASGHLRSRRR